MNATAYLFDIDRATSAPVLFAYLADAVSDSRLTDAERDEIKTAITRRFGVLNAQGASHQPRWSSKRSSGLSDFSQNPS